MNGRNSFRGVCPSLPLLSSRLCSSTPGRQEGHSHIRKFSVTQQLAEPAARGFALCCVQVTAGVSDEEAHSLSVLHDSSRTCIRSPLVFLLNPADA